MNRRKKKVRNQGSVAINLTAMLDMAFQLLAFFVLTFKPSPNEGQISLQMPPAQPVTAVKTNERAGNKDKPDVMVGLNSLVVSVFGNSTGGIGSIAVNETAVGKSGLENLLKRMLTDPASPFEQVVVQVSSDLRYDELMFVVDACTKQKLSDGQSLTKLSFVELPDAPAK